MISQLDIYKDDVLNPKILILKDASFYNPDITPSNPLMVIQYPGSDKYVSFNVGIHFNVIINSNTLGITNVTTSDGLSDLPDGLWTVNYSICPNDELFIEYRFLRTTKLEIKWNNAFCSLEIEKCTKKNYSSDLEKLREISQFIDAAIYMADCCKYEQ